MVNHRGVLVKALDFTRPRIIHLGEEFGLRDIYELVETDTVDIVRLPEGIDIWVDDNGLLKSGNIVLNYQIKSLDGETEGIQLAGNSLFLSSDDEGETIGLTPKQVEWLRNNIKITAYGIVK